MRVAVLAGSIKAGMRIAKEIENLPGIDVSVVACNVGMRSPLLRWIRELLSALKSFKWWTLTTKGCSYAQRGRLIILHRPLDDATSIERLRSLQCDVGLHAANVIYREPTISAFRLGILNAHIGILPKYRGRSVAQWSVLQGDPTGVTVFFIDSGIDTGGRIVLREFIPSDGWHDVGALKNMLFGCDARLYRKALEVLMRPGVQFERNDILKGKRYYIMSKMFTRVVNEVLRDGANLG
ncbi:MAG TPA: formyltransferase family protein [Terriglobales bacterium]|nr:formyltransferase family protein [Terriglobales bacterium]